MNTFDNNLKRLRKERNMKQEDLAEKLHVTRQTISGWETGRRQPDLDTLKQLAEVLEVDVHELIYGSRPGVYPKFQKKYLLCSAAFGAIALALFLFRILLLPYLEIMAHTFYWGTFLTICYQVLPQIEFFSFGLLIPTLIRLFIPIYINRYFRIMYLLVGMLAILPVILLWLGISPWCKWILYRAGRALLTCILPLISGFCIMLSGAYEKTDAAS